MLWRKTFWMNKCEFWLLIKYISYWEVVTRILIFSGRHDLASDARAFSFSCLFKKCKVLHCRWLTVLGCLIFPKCLLDLHNSKRFSLCPCMWLFPARFCHAGPSSLPFTARCLNSHGWWFTEPNREEVDWNEGIYSFFSIAIIVHCQLACSVFL